MAKFPPSRVNFADVTPAPTDDHIVAAFVASLAVLVRHLQRARKAVRLQAESERRRRNS